MLTLTIVIAAFIAGAMIAYSMSLVAKIRRLQADYGLLKGDNDSKQQIIMNLVKDKESRISAQELAEHYVPVQAHHLVSVELTETRQKLSAKEMQLLDLTKALTALKKRRGGGD